MKENTIPITLWLAGRDYRIRIKPEEEEYVRAAIKIASERLQHIRESYEGKDDQDFLAMCLIMYATDRLTQEAALDPVYSGQLKDMEKDIDKALNS